jgi:hypothetical protein
MDGLDKDTVYRAGSVAASSLGTCLMYALVPPSTPGTNTVRENHFMANLRAVEIKAFLAAKSDLGFGEASDFDACRV